MAIKKYLSLERLTEYDGLIKENIDTKISEVNTSISKIIDGTIIVGSAANAAKASTAIKANSATAAEKDFDNRVITEHYETKDDASAKLTEAKTYADNAATTVKNDLLNGAGGAYDTLKELGDLIDGNKNAIDALEIVAVGKADKDHNHDDVYVSKVDIENLELITVNDIDTICGATIQVASSGEVTF